MTLRKKQEKKRLANLKRTPDEHESVNTAKRYKLPEAAVEEIAKAGVVHGQQSRAIQLGAELLYLVGFGVSDEDMKHILDSPLTGKTYKLPERTIRIIQELAPEYVTRGKVLAAIAYLLSKSEPRRGLSKMPLLPTGRFVYAKGQTPEGELAKDIERLTKRKK